MIDKKTYVANNLILGNSLNVILGVSGLISGQIMIGFTENLGMYISSRMQGNVMVVTVDEKVKSTVFDLCKLIIGNSCISLYDSGVSVNITSIGIVNGESIEYSSIGQDVICIPFETQHGKMLICLQLPNNNDEYVND